MVHIWCWMFGHIDRLAVGSLTQMVCLRCTRKNPPDTMVEELKEWLEEKK